MPAIKFVDGRDRKFVSAQEMAERDPRLKRALVRRGDQGGGEADGSVFVHHPGAGGTVHLFEVHLPAGTKVSAHAHDQDEIIVVVDGELVFGRHAYGPASSVSIPAMTLYSFQAGHDGATYMVFRPTGGAESIAKDEFLTRRRQQSGSP